MKCYECARDGLVGGTRAIKSQAELLRTGNDGLRNQLEFDARQFVALLQTLGFVTRLAAWPHDPRMKNVSLDVSN